MRYLLSCFILVLGFTSCEKDKNDTTIDCTGLKHGLLYNDYAHVKQEIEKLCIDLAPNPSATDDIGHEENFNKLIERINKCGDITASVNCYACIETLPAQTELNITFFNNGTIIHKVLDISTPTDDNISFLSMHD